MSTVRKRVNVKKRYDKALQSKLIRRGSLGGIDFNPDLRSKHWVGGGSFEDKKKKRPSNVIVENLPGSGWGVGDIQNCYSGNCGSRMSSSVDTYFDAE